MKFSVLMSLYIKEKVNYFEQCMESILNQTMIPSEIVIVKDGPITIELENSLNNYVKKNVGLYKIVTLPVNRGLGYALSKGVEACTNELIFRMDTDDIAVSNRFELQLKEFMKDSDLDICGGYITEFEDYLENVVAIRRVPISDDDIKIYQKRRDSFNHMTVAFKKTAVLKAGNYKSCLLMEDTLLWVNMIMSGAKCSNIPLSLVNVRVGKDMYKRRGGWDYFVKYKMGRDEVRKTGYISNFDYYYSLFAQIIVSLLPNKIRRLVFTKVLHS